MMTPSAVVAPSTSGPDPDSAEAPRHHIVSVLVENKAGVLSRVTSLFSRRGYNIESLTVAPTSDPRLSRITIVVDVESSPLEQVVRQLDKLIPVVHIAELAPAESVQRELLLVTVRVDDDDRRAVIALVEDLHGAIVDEAPGELTIMLADEPQRINELEESVRSYGIVNIQRTGRVALPRLGDQAPRLHARSGAVHPDPTTNTKVG